MPKVVDHDARRREIVEAFLRLVARSGLAAVTTRRLATEVGMAAGALWRYFDDYDAVVGAAYRRVVDDTNARISAATTGLRGVAAIRGVMQEVLPLEKRTEDEAAIVVSYWGHLARAPELAAARQEVASDWLDLFRTLLGQAVADGELAGNTEIDALADLFVSVASGQQVEYVVGSALAAPARQLRLVNTILTR